VEEPVELTIPAGAVRAEVTVRIQADAAVEPEESFTVSLESVAGGGVAIGDPVGPVRIVDSDGVADSLRALLVSDVEIHEGDQGTRLARFHLQLGGPAVGNQGVVVGTLAGSATADSDFTPRTAAVVTIPSGFGGTTVEIPVLPDTAVEPDETFTVFASNPFGGTLVPLQSGRATGTIVDDDATGPTTTTTTTTSTTTTTTTTTTSTTTTSTTTTQPPAASPPVVSVGSVSALEATSLSQGAFVPLTLSRPADEPVVVRYHTIDGTATAGIDYTPLGTAAAPRTVTIPAGSVQTSINLTVRADAAIEDDETFHVVITDVTGADATTDDTTGTVTIVDGETLPSGTHHLMVSDLTITEGHDGNRRAQFQLQLNRPAPAGDLAVIVTTVNGTATAGTDHQARGPLVVTIPTGFTSRTVDVPLIADTQPEDDETFTLRATTFNPAISFVRNGTGTATLHDDD
jgi:hypothetical protein